MVKKLGLLRKIPQVNSFLHLYSNMQSKTVQKYKKPF